MTGSSPKQNMLYLIRKPPRHSPKYKGRFSLSIHVLDSEKNKTECVGIKELCRIISTLFENGNCLFRPATHKDGIFCMMNEKEMEIFNALPESVKVYLGFGVYDCSDTEFLYRPSWTLKKEIADLFSIRAEYDTGKVGAVYQGTISKSNILAFTNCRKEFEVIINPCYLKNIKKL